MMQHLNVKCHLQLDDDLIKNKMNGITADHSGRCWVQWVSAEMLCASAKDVADRFLFVVAQISTGTTSSVRRTWRRPLTSWPKGSWPPRRSPWSVTRPSRRQTLTGTASSPLLTLRTWSPKLLISWGTERGLSGGWELGRAMQILYMVTERYN